MSWKKALWVGGLAALAFVVWGVFPPSRKPYDDEIALLDRAGVATTFPALVGTTGVEAENGAVSFRAAWQGFAEKGWPPAVTGPWDAEATVPWYETGTPEQYAALRDFLDAERPLLESIDESLRLPRFRFPVTIGADGIFPSWEHLTEMQRAGQLVEARARSGRTAEERVSAICLLARIAGKIEPGTLNDLSLGTSLVTAAIDTARSQVEGGGLSATAVRMPLDPFIRESRVRRLSWAARADLVFQAALYRRTLESNSPSRALGSRIRHLFARFGDTDHLVGIDELTPSEAAEALESFLAFSKSEATTHLSYFAAVRKLQESPHRSDRLVAEHMRSLLDALTRADAQARLARVALAVKERMETAGAWPDSLDRVRRMIPEPSPLDPYTDLPFVFRDDGTTVRICSVGAWGATSPVDDVTLRKNGLLWEFLR